MSNLPKTLAEHSAAYGASKEEFELLKTMENKPVSTKCEHKWTMYTPFRGEGYEVCANDGCKYTKQQYEQERIQGYQATDLRPGNYYLQTQFGDVALDDDSYMYGYGAPPPIKLPLGKSDNAPKGLVDWLDKSKQITQDDKDKHTKALVDAAKKHYDSKS